MIGISWLVSFSVRYLGSGIGEKSERPRRKTRHRPGLLRFLSSEPHAMTVEPGGDRRCFKRSILGAEAPSSEPCPKTGARSRVRQSPRLHEPQCPAALEAADAFRRHVKRFARLRIAAARTRRRRRPPQTGARGPDLEPSTTQVQQTMGRPRPTPDRSRPAPLLSAGERRGSRNGEAGCLGLR